jgi:hypothetical protein
VKNENYILNELNQLSPVVAGISRKSLFEVPENYFEQFADTVMLRIKSMQTNEELPSSLINKNTPFISPPADYFESFAEKMLNRIKAEANNSVDEELAILSPVLSKIKRVTPFSVPQGYFEELSDNVLESAKAIDFVNDGLENLSPLMRDLKNKNTYTIPLGYFENFSDRVLSKIKNEPTKVKVISITNRKTWLKFAAAAIIVGMISTIGFYFFNKSSQPVNADPIAALSKVSDDEMNNYLQNQYSPIYDTVITNTNSPLANIDLSPDNDDAHDLLSNISDDELNQYINQDISIKDEQVN